MKTKWYQRAVRTALAVSITTCFTASSAWSDTLTVGSGGTYATIQAAIDAAAVGDTINVADGTYVLSSALNVNKALTLIGASKAGVVIDASSNGTGYGISIEASNVTLKNFTVLPPVIGTVAGGNFGGFAIHASFNHTTAPYTPYTGLTLEEISISNGNRTAFDIHGYDGVTLKNLTAIDCRWGNGIQLTGCTNVTATGCTTSGNAWGGLAVYCSKSAYLNRASSNVAIDLAANSLAPTVFVEDEFSLVSGPVTISGATFRVDNNYAPGSAAMHVYTTGDLNTALAIRSGLNSKYANTASIISNTTSGNLVAAPGITIQSLIDAASAAAVIEVYPGTYNETAANRTVLSGTPVAQGPYQFGLFFPSDKPGLKVIGVDTAGTPITDPASPNLPVVTTNATNNFGTSGIWVEGNSVTIQGLKIGRNIPGDNKTIEIVSDGFTLRYCDFDVPDGGGAVYFGDWQYDAITGKSFIERYQIDHNSFDDGTQVAVSSGAGHSGSVAGRQITNNSFEFSPTFASTWPGISFNGSGTDVPWYVHPVGGAVITGNTFSGSTQYIRSRGTVGGIDWAACWGTNTFDKKVMASLSATPDPRGYTYTANSYSIPNTKRIAATIQAEIGNAQPGDYVLVGAGTYSEDVMVNKSVHLLGAGPSLTVLIGTMGDATRDTLNISANDAEVAGFQITRAGNTAADWNDANGALNNQGVTIANCSGSLLHDNLITLNRNGMYLSNTSGAVIRNNVIANNRTGIHLVKQAAGPTVTENEITNNWTMGVLFREELPNVGDTPGTSFTNNNISGNWYSQIDDRSTSTATRMVEKNWLGTTTPAKTTAASDEPGYMSQIPNVPGVTGGTATAPGGKPEIAGSTSANLDFNPFLASGADTNVETVTGRGTYGFQGALTNSIEGIFTNQTIANSQTFGNLYVAPGNTITVTGTGDLNVGALNLAAGATLKVTGGELSLDGSTVAGSFTFFNSMGSVNFDDNVTITGSAAGLILVSDVHVAPGATVTVDGNLVIDGCVMDSTGRFNLAVNPTAHFTMARTVMTRGDMTVTSGNTKIYDNRFVTSTIAVNSGTTGAQIYHNLTDSLGWLTDGGTGTVTSVDSWGNVTAPAGTHNDLALGLDLGTLTSAVNGRTKDDADNVFIQPTDVVTASVDVSKLQTKISALEVMLGYSTNHFTASGLALETNWNEMIVPVTNASTAIGKIDSAIGLSFDFTDAAGSAADQTIGSVTLTGKGIEGETLFFQRVKMAGDVFGGETRLTTGGASPAYLAPFTQNSASIFADGTAPTVAAASVNGTQVQPTNGTVDVLDPSPASPPAFVFRTGTPVILTFTATDVGLAGLETGTSDDLLELTNAAEVTNDLALTATNGTGLGTTTLGRADYTVATTDYTVTAAKLAGVVTYTVTLNVPATATTGTYAVAATVRDRSGNVSPLAALGSFKIANEVLATVQLEDFGTASREVTFVATGGVPKTWTKPVSFTLGTGTVPLEDVPAGTTAISAKTAWNLRSKLGVTFTAVGVATVALTGIDKLPGGDLNGDNVVNTLDYSRLRFNWYTTATVADITGDNATNLLDYGTLKRNFYTSGDPQ